MGELHRALHVAEEPRSSDGGEKSVINW